MSMKDKVNTIVKTVNFHLWRIYRIWHFMTVERCHLLSVHSFCDVWIMRTHFCMEFAARDRRKLKKLQNEAAKVIFRCDRLHPSATLWRELHWLPINERVIFKVQLLAFKGMNNFMPAYLSDFFIRYDSRRENLIFIFILCCWIAPLELPPFPYWFLTF